VASRVTPFCMDGRAFVRLLLGDHVEPAAPAAAGGAVQARRPQPSEHGAAARDDASPGASGGCTGAREAGGAAPGGAGGDHKAVAASAGGAEGAAGAAAEGAGAPPGRVRADHVVMNLPASGVEFLDAFWGVLASAPADAPRPLVHCYTFARGDEFEPGALGRPAVRGARARRSA